MAINLLDLVKSQFTGDIVSSAANYLGESPSATQSALGAAIPTLLGGLIQNASTQNGAQNIFNLLKNGGHDGSILNNLGGLFSGGSATAGLIQGGNSILKTLLGDKLGGIIDVIGSVSGLRNSSSSSSLLSMVAPILMGSIGKQVLGSGGGISSLVSLLTSQSDFVKSALPAGISNVLGFSGIGNSVKNTVNSVGNEANSFNWKPWVLGALLLAGALWFAKNGCASKVEEKAANVVEQAKDAAGTAVNAAKTGLDSAGNAVADAANKVAEMFKVTLPGNVVLDVPKGSLEDVFATWLADTKSVVSKDKWFDFDRLLFDTGKSTLQPSSMEQLKNVAAILKAYPKVNIKIGGYTDNTGDAKANLKLSQARAESVKSELVKLGIDVARMAAEGYGDQHPVASNDTEEGRAKNRRIALRVTAK